MRDVQHLDNEAFADAARTGIQREPPLPPAVSRVPDRATPSCVGFGAFVLALIATTAVIDHVP